MANVISPSVAAPHRIPEHRISGLTARSMDGRPDVVACVLVAAYLLWVALRPEAAVLGMATDDAFYYFEIADSIAKGGGSSFDGIAPTNGYHPLWMLCGVAASWILDPLHAAALLLALGAVLGLATMIGVRRLLARELRPAHALLGMLLLLLPHALTAMLNGIETSLALLACLILAAFVALRGALDPASPHRDGAILGALLGFAFLSRLDSMFLALAAGGLTLLHAVFGLASWPRVLARSALMGTTCLLVAGPYLLWNAESFGHLMPVSGAVKSTFPALRSSLGLEGDSALGLALLLASVAATGVVVAYDVRRARSAGPALRSPLVLLCLGCAGHFAHIYLFMGWGVNWWHFALYGLALALAVPAALARILPSLGTRWIAVGAALVVAVSVAAQLRQVQQRFARHGAWREAALWARASTPPDAVFALKDAGVFSYFSERRVVNLDGKANSFAYKDYLERGDVERYLDSVGVSYVADVGAQCHADGLCPINIPRPNREAAALAVSARDEVYRSAPYGGRLMAGDDQRLVIWRYAPANRAALDVQSAARGAE